MQALGVEVQQYGSLLVPLLLSIVTQQELRLIISREFDTGNWSHHELLKVFKTEVEARERCKSMATTRSTTPERKHPPTPPPLTFNALLAAEGQRITCTFCKQEHKSVDCVVVTNVSERKDILKKQGRGFICLKRSHIAKNCNFKRGCSNRSQRHHSSLCTANETPASSNYAAGVTQPSTQESGQPKAAIGIYVDNCVDSNTSILL